MTYTHSLKKNYEFRRVYSRGKSDAAPFVVLYCLKNYKHLNRLGITVGTKVGNAVCRNRVRRKLKEIYRLNETRLRRGWDIVIVARVRSKDAVFSQLQDDLLHSLDKLGLLIPRA